MFDGGFVFVLFVIAAVFIIAKLRKASREAAAKPAQTYRSYPDSLPIRPDAPPSRRPAPSHPGERTPVAAQAVHPTIEDRIGALRTLIADADRAAARIERAIAELKSLALAKAFPADDEQAAPPSSAPAVEDALPAPPSPDGSATKMETGAATNADWSWAAAQPAAEPLPNSTSPAPPASQAESLHAGWSPEVERPDAAERQERIYSLADYGFDAAEIAQRTGTPLGEVELILNLRRRR